MVWWWVGSGENQFNLDLDLEWDLEWDIELDNIVIKLYHYEFIVFQLLIENRSIELELEHRILNLFNVSMFTTSKR